MERNCVYDRKCLNVKNTIEIILERTGKENLQFFEEEWDQLKALCDFFNVVYVMQLI